MPISLGSSAITQDSRHTLLMIVFVQSFYYLALGLCLLMYDQQLSQQQHSGGGLLSSSSSTTSGSNSGAAAVAYDAADAKSAVTAPPRTIRPGEVLALSFLFTGGNFPSHPHHAVVLVFMLHGILLGMCVGGLVERRTWCLDMVLTTEGIFLVTTLFVAGFEGMGWRLACLAVDSVCALCVSLYVAGRREQQEVNFGSSPTTAAV